MNRVKNEEMRRKIVTVKELADRAEQGVLHCFRDVERIEEHLVKVTRSDVRGTGRRGGPQIGWIYSVKRALDARGMSAE